MEHPKRIGKYELREFLGGGMSHVYKAWDTVIQRTVAVKILTEEAAANPEAKARFLREARIAGSISHENIMSVYDFGVEQGRAFMVMEFLQGEDLRSAIKNNRTGDLRNKLRIALQIARSLEYIHQQQVVHRDIKPENIHVNLTGAVKLMDFGIAKTQNLNLTRAGFTLGTPYYMAPEQVMARDVTGAADIYAFGILLCELLTGTRPITGESVEQLFYKILNEPLDLAPLREASVPGPVCALVESCTAKTPEARPQSFAVVRERIDQAIREMEAPAKPAEPDKRLPSRRWLLPATVVAALVVLIAGYFAIRGPKRTPELLSTATGDMVLVPGGSFLSGPNKEMARLGPYYIDKTEVTNSAYAAFCLQRGRPFPEGFPQNRPNYPVVNITIVDAREYAKWADKRLPTKQEWEKAARGTDGRAYPWGNDRDAGRANVADNTGLRTHELQPADSFDQGASPFKVLQMAGNAWEFVDELVTPSPGALETFAKLLQPSPTADEPWYTIRGGAYDFPLVANVTYEWSSVPARYRSTNIGFRCVKDVP